MQIFSLTKLGKKASSNEGPGDEMRVLHKVRDMGRIQDDQLMGDDIFIIRRLVKSGLVQELTS